MVRSWGSYNQTPRGYRVLAVKETVSQAIEHVREGKGPVMVESKTYRYFGHSRSDPRAYRTKYEEKFWRDRDPIKLFRTVLLERGVLTDELVREIDRQAEAEMRVARQFAEESEFPEAEDAFSDLYA